MNWYSRASVIASNHFGYHCSVFYQSDRVSCLFDTVIDFLKKLKLLPKCPLVNLSSSIAWSLVVFVSFTSFPPGFLLSLYFDLTNQEWSKYSWNHFHGNLMYCLLLIIVWMSSFISKCIFLFDIQHYFAAVTILLMFSIWLMWFNISVSILLHTFYRYESWYIQGSTSLRHKIRNERVPVQARLGSLLVLGTQNRYKPPSNL